MSPDGLFSPLGKPFWNAQGSSLSPVHPGWGSLPSARMLSHPYCERPVPQLPHTWSPATGTTRCLLHAPPWHITPVPCMPHAPPRETFTCSALLVTRPCCSLKACSWGHVWEWLFLTKHHWI